MTKSDTSKNNYKLIFKYVSTIFSWTLFTLLLTIGTLLIYYFVASKLYATKGDKYEPAFSIYTIVSGSMEPTIKVYDVIINTKVDKNTGIKVNDVITFTSTSSNTNGMTVTHRVIGIKSLDDGSPCYVTRGDNNSNEDSSCVAGKNVIGKVKAVIPGLGRIQFFLASKFGWLLMIVLPAIYIIIKDLIKIFKVARKNKNEFDDEATKVIELPKFEKDIVPYEEYVKEDEEIRNEVEKRDKKFNLFKKKEKDELDEIELPKIGNKEPKNDLSLTAILPKLKLKNKEKISEEVIVLPKQNEEQKDLFKEPEVELPKPQVAESSKDTERQYEIPVTETEDDEFELPLPKMKSSNEGFKFYDPDSE